MVVRQCVFSNDEPDLHFVEIVSCSKDKRIACFLLLRTRQLKIGSIWVKMRSIRGENFHKNQIGRSNRFQADGPLEVLDRQLKPVSMRSFRKNRLQNYSKMQHKLYYFAL